jgi:uncharacterized protein YfaS (alpha-2-macroglobulin family)
MKRWTSALLIAVVCAWHAGCQDPPTEAPSTQTESDTPTDSGSGWDTDTFSLCAQKEAALFEVDESRLALAIEGDAVVLELPVARLGDGPAQGLAKARLVGAEAGSVEWSEAEDFDVAHGEQLVSLRLTMDSLVTPSDLAKYVIEYSLSSSNGTMLGRRDAYRALHKLQVVLRSPTDLLAGASNGLRLYVQDPSTGSPVSDADVSVRLILGQDSLALYTGKSDATGTVQASFDIPLSAVGHGTIEIEVDSGETRRTMSASVDVSRPTTLLLTTDKPIYQPGQTIHLRTLAMRRPNLVPQAGAAALFEVQDGRGNKVFKQELTTDVYGIAATSFELASEVILGAYTIRATVGDTVSEKTVTVDRYALPKFGVALETDKAFYAPGDTLRGVIDADYFFGKPVSGGSVTVTASKFDVEFEVFSTLAGSTDEQGRYAFDLSLPSYFVGQPLTDGNAFVLLTVQVTDTAGQTRDAQWTKPVAQTPILPQLVPESGTVVGGMTNRFYLLTTNPQGEPIPTSSGVTYNSQIYTVQSFDSGIAIVQLPAPSQGEMSVAVSSTSASGQTGTRLFRFSPGAGGASVLLRTDKAVYQVGDLAQIAIHCPSIGTAAPSFRDRVYLDIIKDGRTVLMTTVPVTENVGSYEFDISPDLVGAFEIEAYYLDANTQILRDRKLIYADPADRLQISVQNDKDVYRPAETAKLTFKVTNRDGLPQPAAIGLQIVDEAVYSLIETRPGLERVFYELEEEYLSPNYEIHGYGAEDITNDQADQSDRRQQAAELLFAAASEAGAGQTLDSYAAELGATVYSSFSLFESSLAPIRHLISAECDKGHSIDANKLVDALHAAEGCWLDPWDQALGFSSNSSYSILTHSAGPDEDWKTADDLTSTLYTECWEDDGGWETDSDWGGEGEGEGEGEGGGDSGPRVRKNFPETLLVEPRLITDGAGEAVLEVPLADSITTWRLGAIASSSNGALGSVEHGIRVFQDFFVDIDFPAKLTQDDEIAVPVAVYNYLDSAQSVTLSVEPADWFELLAVEDKVIELGPGEVVGVTYLIRATRVGWHALRVYGYAGETADAVERRVEIVPNGKEIADSVSGRLTGTINNNVVIPGSAIDEASKIMVKVYPGIAAQAVEGLDSLLSEPCGCFEQTSSATYPNILVLDYMQQTGQINPAIELKARSYVSQGYQRLLTFESPGGGFEWFGGTPAHNILTAYGLLEFRDMSRVHPVDEAVITRTQQWLASQQWADGHFEPTQGGIAEGAINAYEDDIARSTAYIVYALAESGSTGTTTNKGLDWLAAHTADFKDGYGLAMLANAFLSASPKHAALPAILTELYEARVEDASGMHWSGSGETTTYGTASVMDIEATALAGFALLRSGTHSDAVQGALDFLVARKDTLGNWETTQATVLVLRLLLESQKGASEPGPATVRVFIHEELIQTLDIDAATSDVLRLVDLGAQTVVGDNPVRIEIETAEGSSYMYQIVHRYYVPWADSGQGQPSQGPLSIDVSYDKTTLAVDDTVQVTVTITNNVPGSVQKMVLADIGLPPAFDLVTAELSAAVESGSLQRYEVAGRQLVLYIEAIGAQEPYIITYQLVAKYPMNGMSGEAEVHPYYEPSKSSQQPSTELEVTE